MLMQNSCRFKTIALLEAFIPEVRSMYRILSELENSLSKTDLTERSLTLGEVDTSSLGEGEGEF